MRQFVWFRIETNYEVSAMSQSLLYHCLGIKGVTYHSTSFLGNAIILNVETTTRHVQCSSCGHRKSIFKGQKVRCLRMPTIGRKQAILHVVNDKIPGQVIFVMASASGVSGKNLKLCHFEFSKIENRKQFDTQISVTHLQIMNEDLKEIKGNLPIYSFK